jgi:hypothetical protein
MTAEEFRRLALSLPGAEEGMHHGHPDFRTKGRIFASLDRRGLVGTLMLGPEDQAECTALAPEVFAPHAGAWGRRGCTKVVLAAARVPLLRRWMQRAHARVSG